MCEGCGNIVQMGTLHQIRLWNKFRKLPRENPQLYLFPEYKFGYIQIPKVASRSIRVAVTFEEFVRRISVLPDNYSDRHFRSQAWFLTWKGTLLPSFVGKLENMADDWGVLQERFGMALPPQINVSNVKPLPEMSSEIKELIFRRYTHDFELFGYSE